MTRYILKNTISLGLQYLASGMTRHIPKILMYHKFSNLSTMPSVPSAELFEQQLSLIKALHGKGHDIRISVDDGYADFYHVAFPLLKKFNLPATFYITTGFINGELWMWYDKVEYIFKHCNSANYNLVDHRWPFEAINSSTESQLKVTEFLKTIDNDAKSELIADLALQMQVSLPASPPPGYEPCSWDQIKEMDESGLITIGAHSHTHPILTCISEEQLDYELSHSKAVLESQLGHVVHHFCYPNGTVFDYSEIVISKLKSLGYTEAVTAFSDGYNVKDAFHIRRFGGVHSMSQFKKHVYGVEYLSKRIRGWQKGKFKASMPK